MNLLKKATNALFFAVLITSAFQCSSPKTAAVQSETSEFQLTDPIVFQEWYAGINVGGTGINLFIPKFDLDRNIEIDSVYFRNMKGKPISKDKVYAVILKNDSPHYEPNPSNEKTNPFNLTPEECMIRYKDNGQIKYLKVARIIEKAGTYYENGPPSIYDGTASGIIATLEED